jgi:hypothetical protein
MKDQTETDEILGIVKCVRCGHRLEGEIECPFCSLFPDPKRTDELPAWVYITACFITSPLSIYFVIRSHRLSIAEKILAVSGCSFWFAFFSWWL